MKRERVMIMRIAVVLFSVLLLVNCTTNKEDKKTVVDKYERYREIVNSEFGNRAWRYNADTRFLVLVDYSIPSNDYRLFVWDTEKDSVVEKFWCAHGFGGGSTPEKPVFSNVEGSNCSSVGWFLIDKAVGTSVNWGYQYHAVDGLDNTNSNARQRQILIHPWGSVDSDYAMNLQKPMTLDGRCAGCFTTTNKGFETIDRIVKSRQKRVLVYAFYEAPKQR